MDAHAITVAGADHDWPAPVVVAPLGTALTPGHLATMDTGTKRVVLQALVSRLERGVSCSLFCGWRGDHRRSAEAGWQL
jgi:hypothetical protein